jgi:hypothetical protein
MTGAPGSASAMKGWLVRHAAHSIPRFRIDYDLGLEYEEYLAYEVDGEGGDPYALWTRIKVCPVPADGGLQCVDAACNT